MIRFNLILLAVLLTFSNCKKADTESPVFTLCSDPDPVMVLGDTVPDVVVKVADNRSCCLETLVQIDGQANPDKYGDYPIVYSVEDEAGNAAQLDVNIKVTLAPESYHDVFYRGVDSCESGVYEYIASIQDCTCEENLVQIINLGSFGPSSILDFQLSGEFLEEITLDQTAGDIDFLGAGSMGCYGDTILLNWTIDNGSSTDQCATRLVKD